MQIGQELAASAERNGGSYVNHTTCTDARITDTTRLVLTFVSPSKLGSVNGRKYVFRIKGDECNDNLGVEGPISAARFAIDKLCLGKRELRRANEASITAIRVEVVPLKKAEK